MNLAQYITEKPDSSFSSYMGMLSGSMGFNPSKIPLDKFEGHLDKEADPAALNPILFNLLNDIKEQEEEARKQAIAEISPDDLLSKHDWTDFRMRSNLRQLLSEAKQREAMFAREAETRYNQYLNKARQLSDERNKVANYQAALDSGADSTPLIIDQIKEIESRGWWKFVHRFGNQLFFLTGRLQMSDINPAAGINVQMDMGQFIVKIDPINRNVYAFPCFYTPVNGWDQGSFHPHVSGSGGFCWGNGADRFFDALNEGKLTDAMNMVQALLTTYEPSNPYRVLADYVPEQYRHKHNINSRRLDRQIVKAMINAIPYCQYGEIEYVDPRKKFALGKLLKVKTASDAHRIYLIVGNGSAGIRCWRLYEFNDSEDKMVICRLGDKAMTKTYSDIENDERYSIVEEKDIPIGEYLKRHNKNYKDSFKINPDMFLREIIPTGLQGYRTPLNGYAATYISDKIILSNECRIHVGGDDIKPISMDLSNPLEFADVNGEQAKEIFDLIKEHDIEEVSELESHVSKMFYEEFDDECSDCGDTLTWEGYEQYEENYEYMYQKECRNCGYWNQ